MLWRLIWFDHAILLVVGLCCFISSELHLLQFSCLPAVHFKGAYEGNVDAHSAVIASALVAQKDADAGGGPLRILAAAVKAHLFVSLNHTYLVFGYLSQLLEAGVAINVGYVVVHC